jgi:hypothetical protein
MCVGGKCFSRATELRIYFVFFDGGFKDHRNVFRNHLGHFPEGKNGSLGKRIVPAASVYFAQMNLRQFMTEFL